MIGHCLGAAGGLEAIATVKAINTGWLHPTINQFVRAIFLAISWFEQLSELYLILKYNSDGVYTYSYYVFAVVSLYLWDFFQH